MKNSKITTGHLSRNGAPTLFDMALIPVDETDKHFEICPPVVAGEYADYQGALRRRGLRQGMALDELEERIISSMAEDAINVQNACNLVAVVGSFHVVIQDLWWLARKRGKGNDWVDAHPVTRAWADKIASLTGVQGISAVGPDPADEAHKLCHDLAKIHEQKGGDRG
jgi:hypothetical protein